MIEEKDNGLRIDSQLLPQEIMDTEQSLIYREREVLYHLKGVQEFLKNLKRHIVANSDEVTRLWIVGEPTSGKSTTFGQVAAELLYDEVLQRRLFGNDKEIKLHGLAYGYCLAELKKRGELTSPWGQFTEAEYETTSRFLGDRVFLESAHLPRRDPQSAHVLIIEAPAVTQSLDLGKSAVDQSDNNFMILLVTNPEVREKAMGIRDMLWSQRIDLDIRAEYEKRNIVLDGYDDLVFLSKDEIAKEVANRHFVERVEYTVNSDAHKILDGKLPGGTTFTPEELVTDPSLRGKVLRLYYEHLRRTWKIPPKQYITPENFLVEEVHLYRALVKRILMPLDGFELLS